MATFQDLILRCGGVSAIAKVCGIRSQAVSQWRAFPTERCAAIEAGTGVRCEELRPDVAWVRDAEGRVTGYTVPVKVA